MTPASADPTDADTRRMTGPELRASIALASVYGLRMLGLFIILPVFAIHAQALPGGDNPTLVGLALGIYGLTQALFQLPLGMASDRFGRKPVIFTGLALLAAGSFVAALADSVWLTIVGRSLQGAGAISAAAAALVADATRESQRTKAMAMVGASIAVTFALSLVLAPLLYGAIGMSGIFTVTGLLALFAIALVQWATPAGIEPTRSDRSVTREGLARVVLEPDLLRLNLGIFTLHAVQMAMFSVVPPWLVERAGLAVDSHWMLYLPIVVASFALMVPPLLWAERSGRMRTAFIGSVGLLLAIQLAFAVQPSGLIVLAVLLLGFFAAFNMLEACLPSMVSRLAPAESKGAALGVFNTTQSLGLFAGGLIGGWVQHAWGQSAVFACCAVLVALWLGTALRHRNWVSRKGAA